MCLEKRKTVVKAFVTFHFGYCPLFWMCLSKSLIDKLWLLITFLNKRLLRMTYCGISSSFQDLLRKHNSVPIHHRTISQSKNMNLPSHIFYNPKIFIAFYFKIFVCFLFVFDTWNFWVLAFQIYLLIQIFSNYFFYNFSYIIFFFLYPHLTHSTLTIGKISLSILFIFWKILIIRIFLVYTKTITFKYKSW